VLDLLLLFHQPGVFLHMISVSLSQVINLQFKTGNHPGEPCAFHRESSNLNDLILAYLLFSGHLLLQVADVVL